MRYWITTLAILVLAGMAFSTQALAAQAIGTVIGVQGAATALDDGGTRSLEMTSQVYVADTILTGPESKVQILFNDDTILAQGPESESTLSDYAYLAGGEEDSRFMLDMAEGTFRVITGKIVEDNPDEGFRMQTPLAVIGIRGTMTGHLVKPGKEHHYSLDLEGNHTIDVFTRFDNSDASLLQDFQALDITPGAPIGEIRDMTPEEQEYMTNATGISEYNPSAGTLLANNEDSGFSMDDDGVLQDKDDNSLTGESMEMPETESMDTGMMEDMQSGEEVSGTVVDPGFSPDKRTLMGLAREELSPATYDGVNPFVLPVQDIGNNLYLSGDTSGTPNDILKINESGSEIFELIIDHKDVSSPIPLTYTKIGSSSDAEWGYWEASSTFVNLDGRTYELIKVYDVQVDVANAVRPDLAGTYSGTAAGVMTYYGDTYYSTTGAFDCTITDVVSGTVDIDMTVDFGTPGVFSAIGTGSIVNGCFTIPDSDMTSYQIPDYSPNAGTAEVSGAVGADATAAGSFNFTDGTDRHGVGYFVAPHD